MGKNKLKRFSENETFSHVIQPKFADLEQNSFALKSKWHAEFFENTNPIILELGCGKGEYTVGLAKRNTDVNCVGVDIKGARLWRGAKESKEAGMNNVGFLRTKIDFIDRCFGEDEVSQIWCTFSDPQLGRRKSIKKRLTSTKFLGTYQNILKDNGIVHLKTDDPVLYGYTQDVVSHNNLELLHDIPNVYDGDHSDVVPFIQTFYEKKWIEEGRIIRYISFRLPKNKQLIEPPINFEREGFDEE